MVVDWLCLFQILLILGLVRRCHMTTSKETKNVDHPDDEIIVPINQDVFLPAKALLTLDSTLQPLANESICINRTVDKAEPKWIDCIPSIPHKRKFTNMILTSENSSVVLRINDTSSKGTALYTWWTDKRGSFGNSTVTVYTLQAVRSYRSHNQRHEKNIPRLQYHHPWVKMYQLGVNAQKGRTSLVVFESVPNASTDISLGARKKNENIYNCQYVHGNPKSCQSFREDIIPSGIPPFHLTIFKSVTCQMKGHYVFTTTVEGLNVTTVDIRLNVGDNTDLKLEKIKLFNRNTTSLRCQPSKYVYDLAWKFKGITIKNNTKYSISNYMGTSVLSISNFSRDDSGDYICEVRIDCDMALAKAIQLTNPGIQSGDFIHVFYSKGLYCQTVSLFCFTSRDIQHASWKRNMTVLKNSLKYQILRDDDILQLSILNPEPDDVGLYACEVPKGDDILMDTVTVSFADISGSIGSKEVKTSTDAIDYLTTKLAYSGAETTKYFQDGSVGICFLPSISVVMVFICLVLW